MLFTFIMLLVALASGLLCAAIAFVFVCMTYDWVYDNVGWVIKEWRR